MSRIIVSGSAQTVATKFLPPDTAGLEYWGMYGLSATFSARNHAPGKPLASAVGALAYSPNFATFNADTAFVQTEAAQSLDATYFAVLKVPDGANHAIISNFASTPVDPAYPNPARGAQLSVNQGTGAADGLVSPVVGHSRNVAGVDTVLVITLANAATAGQWFCLAGRISSANGETKAWNLTNGQSGAGINTSPQNLGTGKLRIGSSITAGGVGSKDIAMTAIYSQVKTDAQVSAIYLKLKAYYAKRGIAI